MSDADGVARDRDGDIKEEVRDPVGGDGFNAEAREKAEKARSYNSPTSETMTP